MVFSFRAGWLALLLVCGSLPATAQTLPAHYRQTNNIPYVTGGQHRQWLDLYHIPGATNPTPVVVWVHGGGWLTGDENFPRALALTNHNIAVASISYRFTTNQFAPTYPANLPHPAQIHDVKAALRWLRANAAQFNLDPARVGIWGYSSGGHLAALAGTTGHTNLFDVGENLGQSSAVQAVADMSGPANLNLTTVNSQTAGFYTLLLGAPVASNPATLATVNPTSHARAGAPPFLLIHGETDPEVVIAHSEALHTALTNAGVSSLFVRLPGIGHTIPASQDPLTAQWLATNLLAVVTTNPPPTDDLAALSDEFTSAPTLSNFTRLYTVEGWGVDRFTTYNINTTRPGALVMAPRASSWFQDYQAELAFKSVTGDFVVTTDVGVTNVAGTGAPGANYSFAGLLVRAPRPSVTSPATWTAGGENWVVQGVGAGATPGTYSYEQKNTVNSVTTPTFPAGSGRAVLQLVRLGNAMLVLRQPAGGAWSVVARYARADFPATLQVGMSAMGNFSAVSGLTPLVHNQTIVTAQSADLVATFDYFRLQRPVVPGNFAGRDFTSPAQVSDAELLSFLGANANQPPAAGAPGTLQFSATSYSVAEDAGSATIAVTRSGGSSGAVGVSYATSNGSATAGSDYTAASGTLSWANGDSANRTFSVTIANDSTVESSETVNLSLSNPTGGATLGSLATATLTLTDDDVAPPANDLAVLSDEFTDASTLANFQRVNAVEGWNADKLEARDINVSRPGRMTMIPRTGGWFNDYIGELSFKPVSGDFVVTTEVIPRNRAGNAAPSGEYSLAGIMIRTPTGHTTGASGWPLGQQNYVFLSMGAANNPGTYQFEVKNTVNSSSVLAISNAPATQAELQVARLGGAVITLRRDAGGAWLVHRRYARNDLPAALQVGLVAYTDWLGIQARFPIAQPGSYLANNAAVITDQNPGLTAEFEYLRFHRPQIPAQFVGRNFTNPAEVSDAELLSFLGANANVASTNAPVNNSPSFTTLPLSQTVNAGATVTFTAAATGTPAPTFQWQRSGTNLPGATGASLVLNSVQPSDAGNYSVVASNAAGQVTSPAATLTVNAPTPPAVTSPPVDATVAVGGTHTFTVTATGTAPLAYQWQSNLVNLAGATAASLTLNNVQLSFAAQYRVIVTNAAGSATSAAATLTVTNAGAPPVLQPDSATLHHGQKVRIAVLANDPAGVSTGSVQVVQAPQFGTATPDASGRILYQHTSGTPAADSFTYRASSAGGLGNPVTVTLTFATSLRLANPNLNVPAVPPATAIQLVPAFPGTSFAQPICVATPPGETRRLFVIEQRTGVRLIPDVTATTPTAVQFFALADYLTARGEMLGDTFDQGLMGIAFHPGYATNRQFFLTYSARVAGQNFIRLSRFMTQAGNSNAVDTASEVVFLQQPDANGFHLAMDIHFGPDGYLYLSIGDGGGQNDSRGNGQTITRDFFCAISRLDVDKRPGNREPNLHVAVPRDAGLARYSVPSDNPFVTDQPTVLFNGTNYPATSVRTEFWATGFRVPWRFSFDTQTGELWMGDVGQSAREEVNLVTRGGNYGWAWREGTLNGPRVGEQPAGFTSLPPLYEYGPGNGEFQGFSISGGLVYRGTTVSSLSGAYIFADYVSGNIWTLRRNGGTNDVRRIAGEGGITSFGLDPATGALLAVDHNSGRLLRFTSGAAGGDNFPATLSATGLFADLTDLAPAPGVTAYEPILRFWSDHANKRRWLVLPDATNRLTWAREEPWTFPDGMIWVKHFDLEMTRGNPATARRIETRLLVKNAAGSYGVSYRWNDAQTEATLVADAGENIALNVIEGGTPRVQNYRIPSRAECLSCHTPQAGHALSFDTRQLNQTATMNGFTGNQLALLRDAGYFHNPPDSPNLLPRHLRPDETNFPLEARVRSYLAVNCAHCHRAGGTAPSAWDARASLTLEQTGLIHGPAVNNGGNAANRLVVPGDLARSIVLNRVAVANGFTRMPQLGSNELDQEAIALLTAWITQSLPARQTYADWRLTRFGSAVSANGAPEADPDGDRVANREEFLSGTDPLNSQSFPTTTLSVSPSNVTLGLHLPANRWFQVETSTNLLNWTLWDVPGNQALPAPGTPVNLTAPIPAPQQYFRVRLGEN